MTPAQLQVTRRLHLRASSVRRAEILNIDADDALALLQAAAAVEDPRGIFLRLEAGHVVDLLNRIWAGEAAIDRVGRFAQHIADRDAADLASSS